jgi:hypothetical protein
MERTERTPLRTLTNQPSAETYAPGQCGSCHWQRELMQFNVIKPACTVMPKQVVSVGNTVACVAPIIEDLKGGCSMWAPKEDSDG